jgi:phosphatidate cytidylyltransferase
MTGIIVIPILVLFVLYSNIQLFDLLVCTVTLLGLAEFYSMGLPEERFLERVLAVIAGTALVPLLLVQEIVVYQGAMALLFFFFALLFLARFKDLATVIQQLSLVLFGFLYLPLLLGHLALLRALPEGRQWVFLTLLIVMASDTAAYFVGVSLGRRKLYPAISPNKSVEGALGGLAGSLGGAFLGRAWFFHALGVQDCILLGLGVGTLAQLGDLFESMLKRSYQVKDSGKLIPGHGGMLDRLDSLIFAFPAVYYYALLLFRSDG